MSTEIPQEIVKLIFEFVPKDKNCKSPIADLIHNDPYYDKDMTDFQCDIYYDEGVTRLNTNSFYMARYNVLKRTHFEDILMNGIHDNYTSVFNPELLEQINAQIQDFKEFEGPDYIEYAYGWWNVNFES
jgi:hypothetical protein